MSGFCEQCGSALGESAKFCPACGTQVGSTPAPNAPPESESTAESPTLEPSAQAPSPPPPRSDWPLSTGWSIVLGVLTVGLGLLVPLAIYYWRRGQRRSAYIAAGAFGLVVLIFVISSATGGSSKEQAGSPPTTPAETTTAAPTTTSTPTTTPAAPTVPKAEQEARDYISNHGPDINRVQANVLVTEIAVAAVVKSPTQANVNQLAQEAQTAHDNIDNIRADFATDSSDPGELGNAELNAFSGANDLKNAMGALVAYTGSPNAATLAQFTSQFSHAKAEWNSGVRVIYRLSRRSFPKHPPTV